MNIKSILIEKALSAMAAAGIPEGTNPAVTQSTRAQFGDYQINGAMGAAKALKTNPRELAQKIIDNLDVSDLAAKTEIAGPGFINIHLKPEFLATSLEAANQDAKLGVAEHAQAQNVVVDFSSPNLAKEMHVGHLRSTIIGDAVVRALEFRGDKVTRQNHVGDWGTQFGMLIAHLEDMLAQGIDLENVALADLETFYRDAKKRFDDEEGFSDKARDYVVKLQGGDAHCQKLWQLFIDTSVKHSEEVYKKLNVTLTRDDIMAESAYNDRLAGIIELLKEKNIAVEDQGAQVVFLDELANKDGEPSVFIVQKSGGGFLYATTDLAACDYRSNELGAERILIFVDARQSLHFNQVELTARKAGLLRDETSYEFCPFGTMMGSDGKPFKTRTGGTVKLAELLDEAVSRASEKLADRASELSEEARAEIARKVGIGAVKYADLSKHRTSDYIFNWDTMLSFEGATAPYLQYAYTRVRSIFRKAGVDSAALSGSISIVEPQEKALALKLLQLEEVLDLMIGEATPHVLCGYLYELASLYMTFYEACPILKDDVAAEVRESRLLLCNLVARTLHTGLELLGIEVMEQM
ncbi:arginine--tRNA ligase [Pseudoalteromonas sp. DL2-H2.2]|uniref:Arginine--tRNA ligase n=1 Tax=Pseudoalteromonas rubra TaxID=43658 RepID=A0A4Q7EJU8_9GAMM|nr:MULTISPECIES: arginine--tRNA ligase [Pseudoalteromonas]MCF2908408.1 arginine--tRNA ligase [Pseudoalteromonas sp. DL2-H2.2]RZM84340.1 arginine--tRNA ligase [Pseudoalteromonas rubra]